MVRRSGRAVVVEVVERGVEPDGAQVRDERRRVERVVGEKRRGQQVPAVEDALHLDGGAQNGPGELQEALDLAVGVRLLAGPPVAEHAEDAVDEGAHRLVRQDLELRGEERRVALEALLRAECEPDALPCIEPAAGHVAIEARKLGQRDADRAERR
jgi:hypothetical protein